ncbi:hypothetical protein COBT_001094 [Conglomerata obtusa]
MPPVSYITNNRKHFSINKKKQINNNMDYHQNINVYKSNEYINLLRGRSNSHEQKAVFARFNTNTIVLEERETEIASRDDINLHEQVNHIENDDVDRTHQNITGDLVEVTLIEGNCVSNDYDSQEPTIDLIEASPAQIEPTLDYTATNDCVREPTIDFLEASPAQIRTALDYTATNNCVHEPENAFLKASLVQIETSRNCAAINNYDQMPTLLYIDDLPSQIETDKHLMQVKQSLLECADSYNDDSLEHIMDKTLHIPKDNANEINSVDKTGERIVTEQAAMIGLVVLMLQHKSEFLETNTKQEINENIDRFKMETSFNDCSNIHGRDLADEQDFYQEEIIADENYLVGCKTGEFIAGKINELYKSTESIRSLNNDENQTALKLTLDQEFKQKLDQINMLNADRLERINNGEIINVNVVRLSTNLENDDIVENPLELLGETNEEQPVSIKVNEEVEDTGMQEPEDNNVGFFCSFFECFRW